MTRNKCLAHGICILLAFTVGHTANALENNLIPISSKTVGEDKIPYSIYRIKNYTNPQAWIENNYSRDTTAAFYYLPETLMEIDYYGKKAVAFKTYEYNNYVQNILVQDGKNLFLLTTPHGEYNPDGATVFQEILGTTIPETEYTQLNEADHVNSEEPSEQNEAEQENPEDSSQLNEDQLLEQNEFPTMRAAESSFGSKVGSFNGVDAYSNGSTSYASNQYYTYSGYKTGMKWQCVEFDNRYFWIKFGRKIAGGNANTYYSNASSKGLKRAANGGSDKPQVGNILCSAGGKYGHLAIVREVGSNYVKVIHQNWSNSSSDNSKKLTMTVKNGKYTVSGFSSSYPVQGWLWPK